MLIVAPALPEVHAVVAAFDNKVGFTTAANLALHSFLRHLLNLQRQRLMHRAVKSPVTL